MTSLQHPEEPCYEPSLSSLLLSNYLLLTGDGDEAGTNPMLGSSRTLVRFSVRWSSFGESSYSLSGLQLAFVKWSLAAWKR